MGNLACKANITAEGQPTGWASPPRPQPTSPNQASKDTLGITLQDGVVGVVWVLHGNGLGELAEHPLLEGLQPLVVMATAHVFFVLPRTREPALCLAFGPHLLRVDNSYSCHKHVLGALATGMGRTALSPCQGEVVIQKGEGQEKGDLDCVAAAWRQATGCGKLGGGRAPFPGRGARWGVVVGFRKSHA